MNKFNFYSALFALSLSLTGMASENKPNKGIEEDLLLDRRVLELKNSMVIEVIKYYKSLPAGTVPDDAKLDEIVEKFQVDYNNHMEKQRAEERRK